MPWKYGAAMDIGSRQEQQDRLCIIKSHDRQRFLIAVADGMGGLHNGAQAAQAAVDTAMLLFNRSDVPDPQTLLANICFTAHDSINNIPNGGAAAPGTTIALLYIDGRTAYWTHIGDSRLYHFRNGKLLSQTLDHSLLQVMTSKGVVTPGSGAAKLLQNQLYMRLGGERRPQPICGATTVQDGDLFVLCSDGFWQTVQPAQILSALAEYPLGGICEQYLVAMARRLGGFRCDNISLAMIQWQEGGARKFLNRLTGLLNKRDTLSYGD